LHKGLRQTGANHGPGVTLSSQTAGASLLAPLLRRYSLRDAARAGVFIAALLLIWISLRPFIDLTTLTTDFGSGNDTWTYIGFGLLAVVAPLLALRDNARGLAALASPGLALLFGWMVLTVVLSLDQGTSIRRFVLTACAMVTAAAILLLPRSQAELTRWLAAATLTVLALCYLGVLLAPGVSIHQSSDILEPHLAGDWRGVFGHKNGAAAVMALFAFIGLYVASSRAPIAGWAIFIAWVVFLVFTRGKTSTGLLILVLAITAIAPRFRSFAARATLCLTPLVVINVLSVGTVVSPALAALANYLPFDTSFTGRTDIWRFALESIAQRPLTGYGFFAFWGSDSIGLADAGSEWATEASHSHNSYLDTALTMGLPGLALVIAMFVIAPLRNFHAATARQRDGALPLLFLRIWLFGVCLASMESLFLDRADPIWTTFVLGVFGLHYLARFRLKPDEAPVPGPAVSPA
jgi:O-antigen ligase